ncbi:hypothetical protein FH610_024655 [Microbispora catharanthi]|uniref:Uncharacterized protein n=1 Tax=Microbispora catharanthi TaxID=1712871 RepID=A0A5N6BPN2_9ACTN|nr:hypothetical protein FH610_024655 [Microbispora catharanthi]
MQQRDRLLDHPPTHAEAGAVRGAPAGDDGLDLCGPDHAAVLVVVVAAVGIQQLRGVQLRTEAQFLGQRRPCQRRIVWSFALFSG